MSAVRACAVGIRDGGREEAVVGPKRTGGMQVRVQVFPPLKLDERNEHFAALETVDLRCYIESMNAACSFYSQLIEKATTARAAAELEFRLRAAAN